MENHDKLASLRFTGERAIKPATLLATGEVAVGKSVYQPSALNESEWGPARRRPAGEPGSHNTDFRAIADRPEDN